jgi:hypothetical protein
MVATSVGLLNMTTLPAWWPPSGYDEITEDQVRELFAYLRTVTRSVMADARRRIQGRVGNDPIRVDYVTVKRLAGKRLGTFDVVTLIWLSARHGPDSVSVTIGLRRDGRLVTTMGTPERRQQEWVLWEGHHGAS